MIYQCKIGFKDGSNLSYEMDGWANNGNVFQLITYSTEGSLDSSYKIFPLTTIETIDIKCLGDK